MTTNDKVLADFEGFNDAQLENIRKAILDYCGPATARIVVALCRAHQSEPVAEELPVATVLGPDPYDERDGVRFDLEDWENINSLLTGDKLYLRPYRTPTAIINGMVNRFLNWKLPKTFSPDAGISFAPEYNVEYMAKQGKPPCRHEPIGTNLLDADEARQMVMHMIEGMGIGEPCRARLVPEELPAILIEASDILAGTKEMRYPIIDELIGFAGMLAAAPQPKGEKE